MDQKPIRRAEDMASKREQEKQQQKDKEYALHVQEVQRNQKAERIYIFGFLLIYTVIICITATVMAGWNGVLIFIVAVLISLAILFTVIYVIKRLVHILNQPRQRHWRRELNRHRGGRQALRK
jgi:uncharacterized membrane protein